MVPAVNVTVHSVWLMFTVLDSIHVRLSFMPPTYLHTQPHVHISICMYTYLAQSHATMTSVCIGGEGHEVVNVEEIQELPSSRNKRERSWYTADLLRIAQCTPVSAGQVMGNLGKIKTPLVASAWSKALEQHPDRDFVEFVMNGIV